MSTIQTGESMVLEEKHIRLFWPRVLKVESGCWEWTGSKWDTGYGRLMVGKKRCKAHRVSYLLHNGALPSDRCVCHRCDNPSCVNPRHLFLGTNKENSDDMTKKGRSTHGNRNGRAILTEEAVKEIRAAKTCRTGRVCRELAKKFGVSINSIYHVRGKQTWTRI